MQLVSYNKKSNTSVTEMTKFIAKGLVGSLDMAIIDTLFTYKILNRHILEQYLSYTVPNYKSKGIKNKLKKLVELGIIIRYAYEYEDNSEISKTPYFYSLSYGAYKYMARFSKAVCGDYENMDTNTSYKLLATNQFHVLFLKAYGDIVSHEYLNKTISMGNQILTLDAAFRIKTRKVANKFVDLVVIPVRQNDMWKDELIAKIMQLIEYTEITNSVIHSPIFVFLAENDNHIKDIDLVIRKNKIDFKGNIRLYTTDLQIAREPICDYLYECLHSDELNEDYNNNLVVRKILF